MFLSSLCFPMRIASIAGSGIKSLFTGIDSRDTAVLAVSSTHLIYSFMSFFYLFIFFLSLLTFFFQIDRLEPSFMDSVFRFRFRIPCFSAAGGAAKLHCSLDQPTQSGQFRFSINFCHPTAIFKPKKQRAFPSHCNRT